jgi:hypothetical protein
MKFSLPQPNALAAILGAANNSAPDGGGVSRDEMEAAARARGYRSYDHMIYSMQHRLPAPKVPGQGSPASSGGGMLSNVLQALGGAFSWHPASTLGRVNSAFDGINQGD